jgi:hypothetical protein
MMEFSRRGGGESGLVDGRDADALVVTRDRVKLEPLSIKVFAGGRAER